MKTKLILLGIVIIIWILWQGIKSSKRVKRLDKDPSSPMFRWKINDLDPDTIYPWSDVFRSTLVKDDSSARNGYLSASKMCQCFSGSETDKSNLFTVYFKSPPWTWKKLCGRAGYLTICRKHKKQVSFECTVMN